MIAWYGGASEMALGETLATRWLYEAQEVSNQWTEVWGFHAVRGSTNPGGHVLRHQVLELVDV